MSVIVGNSINNKEPEGMMLVIVHAGFSTRFGLGGKMGFMCNCCPCLFKLFPLLKALRRRFRSAALESELCRNCHTEPFGHLNPADLDSDTISRP